jgi:hypothetical protein
MNKRILLMAVLAAIGLIITTPMQASAGLVYDDSILIQAQGFGNENKDLTVQATGGTTSPESGCVGWDGAIVIGSDACLDVDAAHDPDGTINLGGDEPEPTADNQKYGAPLESELGNPTAEDIAILFNATEPQGDAITITDLTLKFYDGTTLIGSIDLSGAGPDGITGSETFASSQPGLGSAGFTFVISSDEWDYVNGLLAQGDIRLALEATLEGSSGGEETFQLVNLDTVTVVPEPTSMLLLGTGLVGLAARARRSRKSGK